MRLLKQGSPEFDQSIAALKLRRHRLMDDLISEVDAAFAAYRSEKEAALIQWASEFDGVELDENNLWIEEDYIKTSHKLISSDIRKAIDHALQRVERFQSELKLASFQSSEEAGVFWGTEIRPLDRVGIYVPGGRANYFMTLLLCAVPARMAGVKDILVATPPKRRLEKPYIDPTLLYLAKLFEIPRILISGSIGGMAALAFGTKRTEPVEKIVGSGGIRASVAKMRLSGFVGVEGFSGPSETAFVCDKSTSLDAIVADIIGKADHDPEAEIFVFHTQEKWLQSLVERLATEVQSLKDQAEQQSIEACIERRLILFQTKDVSKAIDLVNELAPGVVCLAMDNASERVADLRACGSVLLGHFTPPVGLDLVGGASGLVGTMGSASYSVSMSPASFVRRFTVMEFDKDALERFSRESVQLAKEEGFLAHERSFKARLTT